MGNEKVRKGKVALVSAALVILIMATAISVQSVNAASNLPLNWVGSSPTTITFSWGTTGDRSFSRYDIFMAERYNGPYNRVWGTTDRSETSAYISNLIPDTNYWFYLTDTDMQGSQDSAIIMATTARNPTLSVIAQTGNSISLAWDDNNIYSTLIPFRPCNIQISTAGSSGPYSTVAATTDSSQTTYTVTGLSAGTYSLRLYQTAGPGFASYSNVVSVSLVESAATATPISTPTPTPAPQQTSSAQPTTQPTAAPITQPPTAQPTATPEPDTGIPALYIGVIAAIVIIAVLGTVGFAVQKRMRKTKKP
jgi:hypothetical protein